MNSDCSLPAGDKVVVEKDTMTSPPTPNDYPSGSNWNKVKQLSHG